MLAMRSMQQARNLSTLAVEFSSFDAFDTFFIHLCVHVRTWMYQLQMFDPTRFKKCVATKRRIVTSKFVEGAILILSCVLPNFCCCCYGSILVLLTQVVLVLIEILLLRVKYAVDLETDTMKFSHCLEKRC